MKQEPPQCESFFVTGCTNDYKVWWTEYDSIGCFPP